MSTDQTVPMEQFDLGPYCLRYRLPKNISTPGDKQQKLRLSFVAKFWLS